VVYVKLRAGTAHSIKLGREKAGNDSRGSE
jgi:hypothetical protein